MSDDSNPAIGERATVRRLIGVYDADGTVLGELSYWLGARLGRRHCSLCDVTHGSIRVSKEWVRCREQLAVPFDTFHRNDQPSAVRSATGNTAPVVVAETDDGICLLLDDAAIASCDGSAERLRAAIDAALPGRGIRWP